MRGQRKQRIMNICEVCGNVFASSRKDAKTCKTACRVKKARDLKSGKGRGWYAVRDIYKQMFQEMSKTIGEDACNTIASLLYSNSAGAAEYAIKALSEALRFMEAEHERKIA